MKILGFLQNMWFKDPDAARAIFGRHPDKRNRLIAGFLFMGGTTGKRLLQTLGDDLCYRIVWEETSPEIGAHSSSRFEADLDHMKSAIDTHKPDLILGFGKIAETALKELNWGLRPSLMGKILYAPHPTARTNPLPALRDLAAQIRSREASAA